MTEPEKPRARHHSLHEIPAGNTPSICKGEHCNKKIYYARNPRTGRNLVLSTDWPGGSEPTATTSGWGVSHFANCPDAAHFSKSYTGKGRRRDDHL